MKNQKPELGCTVSCATSLVKDEIWKPIPGFIGYEASSEGEVRSLSGGRRSGKILRQKCFSRYGYRDVSLCKNGKVFTRIVHRLIAITFHGDRSSERLVVAHLNGDGSDNRACNLQWCSASENESHKRAHGKLACGEKNGGAKITNREARQVVALSENGRSVKFLMRHFGLSKTSIHEILSGKTWGLITGRTRCPVTRKTVRVCEVAKKEAA